jgi:hypothetical protein
MYTLNPCVPGAKRCFKLLLPICSNDAFDSMTGVDTADRKPESMVNLTGLSASWLLGIAFLALIAGLSQLMGPVLSSGSTLPGAMLLAAIACGYMYQSPPFRQVFQLLCLRNNNAHSRICVSALLPAFSQVLQFFLYLFFQQVRLSPVMRPVLSTRLSGAMLLAAVACGYACQCLPFRQVFQLS